MHVQRDIFYNFIYLYLKKLIYSNLIIPNTIIELIFSLRFYNKVINQPTIYNNYDAILVLYQVPATKTIGNLKILVVH